MHAAEKARRWFVEYLSQTSAAHLSVTVVIAMTAPNLAIPKAAVKHKFLFKKPTLEPI